MTSTESIPHSIYLNDTPLHSARQAATSAAPGGEFVQLDGETYYRIANYDQMPPFFMSLISGADHWLFIASNGGLTAGRRNADSALFPYETEDKLVAHADKSGGKSIVRVTRAGRTFLWEPFSERYAGLYRCERHLYKNIAGSRLIFEEINHDLRLTLRTAWHTGDRFGFIRSGWLHNDGDGPCHIALLDGLLNLLPYGATAALQSNFSNLLDAYKRNELDPQTGLGIFALSATLSDRAEPSESLRATVAWQVGLDASHHLLSPRQLDDFRQGRALHAESDLRGQSAAYVVESTFELAPGDAKAWHVVADVNQDGADVVRLNRLLAEPPAVLVEALEADVEATARVLRRYVAAADGLQYTASRSTTAHHFANVMFNIMRGGIFADGYRVHREDLLTFIRTRNRAVLAAHAAWFDALPDALAISDLYARATASGEPNLVRLCYEYLPLTFSRRHGDPSRPWNQFSINLTHPDGSPRLDYQGNWRDIFQNWEPLLLAFPDYLPGVISKFLNATSADGYNPYRVTRAGIEWEIPDPEHPWANIGYWSDHQIIYLQKLLELAEQVNPGRTRRLWDEAIFAYANVPYRLRPYRDMLADWSNTIIFDWERQKATAAAVDAVGTDGRLLRTEAGDVLHVTMIEKLLVLLLAKLTNLVPGGGIWMNTQRPEWNDANNALVGKGLSVVTTAYLRRFVAFWREQLREADQTSFVVNEGLAVLFETVSEILAAHEPRLAAGFDDRARRVIMDELGAAATAYRQQIYDDGVPPRQTTLEREALQRLLSLALAYLEETLRANRRPDGLYHGYNILRLAEDEAGVDHLYTMLEGQVAILSAGVLSSREALALLRALPESDIYRADQHSYMLYPNRDLPNFREKNRVPAGKVAGSALVAALDAAGDPRLLVRDVAGDYHFSGDFHNARDVAQALDRLAEEAAYANLVPPEREQILALFEETFNHRAFTGRSGTFFAYEGLGSIYWHMVSKLLLAAQECYWRAVDEGAEQDVVEGLADAYYDIRAGLGFNKEPALYGAFPTDPYSHTPAGGGARQPGMTGQVKEELLTRMGELGIVVAGGALHFTPSLLDEAEFLPEPARYDYVDVAGQEQQITLPAGALAFTICQTPVVYRRAGDADDGEPGGGAITVSYADGRTVVVPELNLDRERSAQIFHRDGAISRLTVTLP